MANWESNKVTLISFFSGTTIGFVAWLPFEFSVSVVLLIPLLLANAKTKTQYLLVMISYYLASSYGVIQGAAQFPGGSWAMGAGLWLVTSSLMSLPYLLVWKFRKFGWGLACIALFLPPIGFLNWVSPLLVSAYLFPNLGFLGIILTVISFTIIQLRPKVVVAFFTLALATHLLVEPSTQNQFVAVNTKFPTLAPEQISFSTDLKSLKAISKLATLDSNHIQVFPESSIRHWTPYTGDTLSSYLEKTGGTILLGVQYPDYSDSGDTSWVNAIAMVNKDTHEIIYKQRTPIPYFMWKPGEDGYKRSTGDSIISINNTRVKMLICYEVFNLKSLFAELYSLNKKPDLFVSIGNYAWANGTNLESIYRKKTKLIERLFMRPFLVSTNTNS